MSKFLLIDGNAILHRAYHAFPPLTNPKGEVVNAVYGFFSMLLTVLKDQNPQYLAVAFDRSKPTIRQSMYANYHAHRPQMTSDFALQIPIVHDILEKMGVQMFSLDGYEGDDMIGTLATRIVASAELRKTPAQNKAEVVILTGDRDMLQLINEHVKILMPLAGISKATLFDSTMVEEKYGVKPSQFIDYKALIGDQSDGYPGVTGIGPKTAAKLLQTYGTFENLYEHIADLPEKTALLLATDTEQAALAKKLATILTDVPFQFDIEKCHTNIFDIQKAQELFEEQNFQSLIKKIEALYPVVLRKSKVKPTPKPLGDQLELL